MRPISSLTVVRRPSLAETFLQMTSIAWLEPGEPFPDPSRAWGSDDPAPGLLAAGGELGEARLLDAYSRGIFPWFSTGQPVLWWSPDPRMVLRPPQFRLHRSLRHALRKHLASPAGDIRIDHDFRGVITSCASSLRNGQNGTWILPGMVEAYCKLHSAGNAHSIETWEDGELVGGLYCVAIGHAVFGESMFARRTDASKIALAALMALCRAQQVPLVDCQQNTSHLASLGAREIPRQEFLSITGKACQQPRLDWRFDPLYWNEIISPGEC